VGVGRFIKLHHSDTAEFAVIVSDAYQRRGIGTELLRRLIRIARDERLRRLTLQILPENRSMLRSCQKVGATSFKRVGSLLQVDIDLSLYQRQGT
jgi:acetyltransferase